ncbi:hypothetical protein E4U42_004519 [Claviceps africana]|uniref:Mucin n=1 Tax=Claviceps africana TaxID=83212 RepID=A0A8K0NLG1_9HYPO|nr:hypothetical protein E4U42_004519 [Claviceps africana]
MSWSLPVELVELVELVEEVEEAEVVEEVEKVEQHECNHQQGCPSDKGSLHTDRTSSPRFKSMGSFLGLPLATDSTFSLSIDDSSYTEFYGASFQLLSSAPRVTSNTATDTISHIGIDIDIDLDKDHGEKMDSSMTSPDVDGMGRGSLPPNFASFQTSGTTTTTCSSSRRSANSQRRVSLLAGALRQVSRLRQPASIDENLDRADECQFSPRQHRRHQGGTTLLGRNKSEPTPRAPLRSKSQRTNHGENAVQRASKPWRSPSDRKCTSSDGFPPTLSMTKGEFEALPFTIQRKVSRESNDVTGNEAKQMAKDGTAAGQHAASIPNEWPRHSVPSLWTNQEYNELDSHCQARLDSSHAVPSTFDDQDQQQPTLKLGFGQDELENAPHRRTQANSKPLRVYGRSDKRSVKRYPSSSDVLSPPRVRQSVILDATEESMVRLVKRQSQTPGPPQVLPSCCTDSRPKITKMVSFSSDNPATTVEPDSTAAAAASTTTSTTASTNMFESFSWLEESEDLDLRLLLHDYHFDHGRESGRAPAKRRPSLRRRLSISKLPFGKRASVAVDEAQNKDASVRECVVASSPRSSVPSSPAPRHARRRSRALSLITSTRQPVPVSEPDLSTFVDPAAAHYQDPDARMKLRVYLASAHKFDEAIEFGFPSVGDVQETGHARGHRRAASQREESSSGLYRPPPCTQDDKSSMYSDGDNDDDDDDDDEASATEPDSPRTPLAAEKPLLMKSTKDCREEEYHVPKEEHAHHAPTTLREMTLRMTLTRPDLRANEEQIYGWQRMSSGQRKSSQAKHEPHVAAPLLRDGQSNKATIERQFAALDQEGLVENDDGPVKRFWNRVRRA